ncbi:MAG: hypothetical protein HZA50_18715 [Planctomycetes bacterium]|nr:hypothetical protein [Planctomycetota bacterium]
MVLSIPRKALEITEIPADGKIRINGFLPSDLPIPPFVRLEMAVNKAAQDISRRSITLDCGILAENLFVTSRIKYNDTFGIKLAKEVQEGAAISTCRGTAQISLTLPLKENGETGRQILAKYGLALDIAGQLVSKWKFWWEEMEIPSSQPSK